MNIRLRHAIETARASSVPKDNIERAIARGSGSEEGVVYDEVWYEGYAPGGVAIYVQVLTDNRNRAASDVRAAFNKNNGSLGEPGSVGYLFEQKGYVLARGDEDTIMMAALEGGADDVTASDDQWEVICAPNALESVRAALEAEEVEIEQAEVTQMPSVSVAVDEAGAGKVLRLVDALEDLDDVQSVYGNFDIPDEVLAALG